MGSPSYPAKTKKENPLTRKMAEMQQRKENAALGLGMNYKAVKPTSVENGAGSLANIYEPLPGEELQDILKKYPWTISSKWDRTDIPYIQLKEHKITGGQIQKQLSFYAKGIYGVGQNLTELALGTGGADADILDVYKEIFPRDPTGFVYKFPYFAKAYYELSTPQWQQFDKIGQAGTDIAGGIKKIVGERGKGVVDLVQSIASATTSLAEAGLMTVYPVIGVADRPRIFTSHNERTVKVEFPLYNTKNSWDWIKNKDFIHLFAAQNLFNKRNFITGLPPVWYEVFVPGSYYSVASCVTQFDVQNLGNVRLISNGSIEFVVPDAYQVSISLTEMALPSRNQFQAAFSGLGKNRVSSSVIDPTDYSFNLPEQPQPQTRTVQERVNNITPADVATMVDPKTATGRPMSSSSFY